MQFNLKKGAKMLTKKKNSKSNDNICKMHAAADYVIIECAPLFNNIK